MSDTVSGPKTSGQALASLILGVLSVTMCGLFCGLPAVILGHTARRKIKNSDGTLGGDAFALTGLITGYIGTFLTSLFVLGVLAGMFLPAVAAARERARMAKCANNLSQIGKACLMYSMDNDKKYPSDFKSLGKYVRNSSSLFVCPSTGRQPGDFASVDTWTDYVLVAGRSASDGPGTPLVFCRRECHRNLGGNVLATDGSVRWYCPEEYDTLTPSGQQKPTIPER